MQTTEADQLREDIALLRTIVDAALDAGHDDVLLRAAADVLRERKALLEELEPPDELRARYGRALP
jgi:hypothetical protein